MKNHQRDGHEQGFTLVELIVGMAIIVILMTGIVSLLGVTLQSHRFASGRVADIQQSRLAVNTIIDEIRYAKTIVPPAAPFQTLHYTDVNDKQNTLSFNTADKKIYVTYDSASPKAVTAGVVQNLTFKVDSLDSKTIKVNITFRDVQTQQELITETKVRLLNKE